MTIRPDDLAALPGFSELDRASLGALAGRMVERHHRDGAVIAEQGGLGTCAWVVLGGRLAVERRVAGGRLVLLRELGPGDIFGVLALVENARREARVVARGAVRLGELPHAEALDLFNGRRPLALRFQVLAIRSLFADLRATNRRLAELAALPPVEIA